MYCEDTVPQAQLSWARRAATQHNEVFMQQRQRKFLNTTGAVRLSVCTDVEIWKCRITPEIARSWLLQSHGNRHLSPTLIAAYADAMRRNEFPVTNTGIGFTYDGVLIDGHHRLHAIECAKKPVVMLVFLLSPATQDKIDIGKPRSIADRLQMFRGATNTRALASYVNFCAYLIAGEEIPPLRTLDDYDRWFTRVEAGVTWALGALRKTSEYAVSSAAVGGALAFAHKTNPAAIEDFGVKVRDGIQLKKGDPAYKLRAILHGMRGAGLGGASGRAMIARKVLMCAMAACQGRETFLISNCDAGLVFFRKVYTDV